MHDWFDQDVWTSIGQKGRFFNQLCPQVKNMFSTLAFLAQLQSGALTPSAPASPSGQPPAPERRVRLDQLTPAATRTLRAIASAGPRWSYFCHTLSFVIRVPW